MSNVLVEEHAEVFVEGGMLVVIHTDVEELKDS